MSSVIEQFIRYLEPKSFRFSERSGGGGRSQRMGGDEMFAALNMAAQHHPLGLAVLRGRYLADADAVETVRETIELRCLALQVGQERIASIIVCAMLFDRPLITQRNHLRSLHRRFGAAANSTNATIKSLTKRISELNNSEMPTRYLREIYSQQIEHAQHSLELVAEERSVKTNRCPRCSFGKGTCPSCGGSGRIVVRMDDAMRFYEALGHKKSSRIFTVQYWPKILSLLAELQIKENDAVRSMQIRMRDEFSA